MKLLELKFSWLATPNSLIGYLGIQRQNARYRQSQPMLLAQTKSREENSENLKIVKFLHFHFTLHGLLKPELSPS
jgi:hypothetical protein